MDAVKFLMEFNRMHQHCDCEDCPRHKEGCSVFGTRKPYLEKLVSDVEKWSRENPQKTNLMDFLEKFPKAQISKDGLPEICCAKLGYACSCLNSTCRDCWNAPLEDSEEE